MTEYQMHFPGREKTDWIGKGGVLVGGSSPSVVRGKEWIGVVCDWEES